MLVSMVHGDGRGAEFVQRNGKEFAKWDTWSPLGWLDDAIFEEVAKSFETRIGLKSRCIPIGSDGKKPSLILAMPNSPAGRHRSSS